jgi:hypothetical protein
MPATEHERHRGLPGSLKALCVRVPLLSTFIARCVTANSLSCPSHFTIMPAKPFTFYTIIYITTNTSKTWFFFFFFSNSHDFGFSLEWKRSFVIDEENRKKNLV